MIRFVGIDEYMYMLSRHEQNKISWLVMGTMG